MVSFITQMHVTDRDKMTSPIREVKRYSTNPASMLTEWIWFFAWPSQHYVEYSRKILLINWVLCINICATS